jgi:hypothetical protein
MNAWDLSNAVHRITVTVEVEYHDGSRERLTEVGDSACTWPGGWSPSSTPGMADRLCDALKRRAHDYIYARSHLGVPGSLKRQRRGH